MPTKVHQKNVRPDIALCGTLIISIGVATLVQWEALSNPMVINDDLRNQIYWMARQIDASLFPNDLIASYFSQPSLISPVLALIYGLGSHWMDPVRLSQLLPLLLAPLATFFVYRFAENQFGKQYGFLAAFAFNMV